MIVDTSIPQPQPLPATGVMSSSDIVDHMDKVLASQPQPVQAAVDHAHSIMGMNPPSSNGAVSPLAQSPAPSAPESAPMSSGPIGGDSAPLPRMSSDMPDHQPLPVRASGPSMDSTAPSMPTAQPIQNPHMQNLERMTTEGPGVNKIHNPFLRGLAKVGDVIGSGIFPEFAQFVPGTSAHHAQLIGEEENQLGNEQKQAKSDADIAHAQAETQEVGSLGREADARAQALTHPPDPKEWTQVTDPIIDPAHPELGPQVAYVSKNDPTKIQFLGKMGAKPTEDKTSANVHVLPDGTVVSVNHDQKTGKSTAEVVYKGDPKEGPPKVVQLEKNGKPHAVLVKEDGTEIKDLGETGVKPPVVSVNAGNSALDHEVGQYGKKYETMSAGVDSQLDKILDAEKMVAGGAVSQALAIPKVLTALVSGQGSGVRITQAELNTLAQARGIGGDIEGFFKKLSGQGVLTDSQKTELNSLLSAVRQRIMAKKQIADDAADAIRNSGSRDEILRHVSEYDKKLSSQEPSGSSKTYTQADVDAAVAAGNGDAKTIESAFKAKGYVKK